MAPKPKTKWKPPPKPKLTLAQQQAAEAARIADLAITPGKTEIANAIKEAEDRRILAARAAEGIGRVLSDMTKGDAEALRAAYADSASRLGSYGSALTGPVRSAIDSAASQARAGIAGLGLPGDVKSGSGDVVNTALMYSVRPTSDSLLAAAPRALEANQMRRSAAGLRLADSASAIDWKAIEGIEGLRGEIQKLEAKRPGLILDALGDIRQQANAERATNTQIGYLQLSQAKSLEDQAIAKTNISGQLHIVVGKGKNARVVNTRKVAAGSDAIQAQIRAETSRANARLAAQSAAASQARAEAGRNARHKAGLEAAAKVEKQKRDNPSADITPNQKATIITGAQATGTNVLNDYLDQIAANVPDSDGQRQGETPTQFQERRKRVMAEYKRRLRLNRGTALAKVINAIGPNLKLVGWTSQQIRDLAVRIVSSEIPATPRGDKDSGV